MSDLLAGILLGTVFALTVIVAVVAAIYTAREARKSRREAQSLRADILTTQRNMVTMLGMVVSLDPDGKLGAEAQGLAGRIRSLSAKVASGVVAEGGELPKPVEAKVHEPIDLETRWALDCERNGWKDAQDIPLDGEDLTVARQLAESYHRRENAERAQKAR